MEVASLAAMVMFQTIAELDVSRRRPQIANVPETERSTALIEADVPLVTHTPEPKDKTLSVSLTNAVTTRSSLG